MKPLSRKELEARSKDTLIQYVGQLQSELAEMHEERRKNDVPVEHDRRTACAVSSNTV